MFFCSLKSLFKQTSKKQHYLAKLNLNVNMLLQCEYHCN